MQRGTFEFDAVNARRNATARRLKSRARPVFLLAAAAVVSTLGGVTSAATKTFSSTGQSWLTGSNWSPTGVPAATDDVLINAGTADMTITGTTFTTLFINYTNASSRLLGNATTAATDSTLTLNGSGATPLISVAPASGTPTFTIRGPNNSTGTGVLRLALGAAGSFSVATGATLAVSSPISGAFALTKAGAGILTLSGTNTYSGLTLSAGTLNINSATALGAAAGTFTIGAGTTINNNSGLAVTNSNNNPISIGTGFTYTGTNTLNLGAGATTLTANTTITTTAGSLTLDGVIGGSGFTLTKAGAGALLLSNLNGTFGGVALNAGTLGIVGGSSLGGGTAGITFGGNATVRVLGTTAVGVGRTFAIGTNTATFDSNGLSTTFSNNLTGTTGSVVKTGTGTITLAGTNTYAGTTTVNGGGVTLTGSNASATYAVNAGGTFTIGAAGSIPATSTVGLSGGTLAVAAGRTASQTINGLALNAGASTVSVGSFTTAGNSLALGAITRATGATVDFALPATGSVTTTTPNANFTGGQPTILGPYATVGGTTWAVSGTGATAGAISGLTAYDTTFAVPAADVDLVASITQDVAVSAINSLRFNTAAPIAATLDPAGLAIATGGILVTSAVGANTSTITGGPVTSNNGQDVAVIQNNTAGVLALESIVVDAGATAIGLTKSGPGTVVVTGGNTNTGVTTIAAGTLQVGNGGTTGSLGAGAIASVGTLAVNRSDDLTIGSTITGTGSVVQNGGGVLTLASNANTFTGGLTINSGVVAFANTLAIAGNNAGALTINNGATARFTGGSSFILSKAVALGTGVATIETSNAAGTLSQQGVVSGAGTLVKTGPGTLTLTASNTFTGGININAGTVNITSTGGLGTSGTAAVPVFANIADGATLMFSSGTVNYGSGRAISLAAANAAVNIASGSSIQFSGPFTGGTLNKTGAGTLILNADDSYAGGTIVSNGTVNGITSNALGGGGTGGTGVGGPLLLNPASGNTATVILQAAAPKVASLASTGAGTSVVRLGDSDGFATNLTVGGGNASTVYAGLLADLTTASTPVTAGIGSVTKVGTGSLSLSGTNTYTGTTTVSAGTLRADNATSSVGTSTVAVNGGTLAGNGRTGTGAINVASGGTVSAGTGSTTGDVPGTLTTANQTWASGGKYVWKTTDSAGTPGSTWDLLNIGTLTASSGFIVQAILGTTIGGTPGTFTPPEATMTYQLAHTSNTSAVNVSGFVLDTSGLGVPADVGTFALSFDPAAGGGFDLNLTYNAAPEPTTAALVGLGGAAVLGRRRRKAGGRSLWQALAGGRD